MKELKHQAVITRSAADLRLLVNQAQVALKAFYECRQKGAEHFRKLGMLLGDIKAACGHGQWATTLKEKFPDLGERSARRAMALAKYDTASHLDDQWRLICGHGETSEPKTEDSVKESEEEPKSDTASDLDDKVKPAGNSDADAESSEDKPKKTTPNKPPDEPAATSIPERLQPIFASVELFENAARRAMMLANVWMEIEATPAYRRAVDGTKHRVNSTYIRSAARNVEQITPVQPCPDCGGAYEPSPDSDLCEVCHGKGYQTKADLEVDE